MGPKLQKKKLRLGVVKWPAQGHAARELWSWDSKPGLFVPQYKTTESSWGKVSTECYSIAGLRPIWMHEASSSLNGA